METLHAISKWFRRWRSAPLDTPPPGHGAPATGLPPPSVPAVLPDIEGGDPNLLPFNATRVPLRVEFPMWMNSAPEPEAPEVLEFYWGVELVETKRWTAPVPADDLFIMVPARYLSEGRHTLHYNVTTYNGNQADSQLLPVTIDKTPPLLLDEGPLALPSEALDEGVTDKYLKAHGDRLRAQVPEYLGASPGDRLTWYWSRTAVGPEQVGSRTLALGDIGQPLFVDIPGDFIRASGDGYRYAFYTLQDRAQTPLQRALAVALDVAATPTPRDFPPPSIKEASGGTLLPGNAGNGVTLVVPAQATVEPDEQIEVFWGTPGTPGAYQTSIALSEGSREYRIPRHYVAPHLGKRLVLHYEVTTADGEQLPSREQALQVQLPTGLPVVQCDKVSAGRLSLKALENADARFTLGSWAFMDTSQFVTLIIEGLGPDNRKQTINVVTAMPVPSVGGPISVGSVARAQLAGWQLNLQIEIKARVSFDNQQTWVSFPLLKPTLVA